MIVARTTVTTAITTKGMRITTKATTIMAKTMMTTIITGSIETSRPLSGVEAM